MDLNRDSLNALIRISVSDEDAYDLISGALKSFQEYHAAIYEMETVNAELIYV